MPTPQDFEQSSQSDHSLQTQSTMTACGQEICQGHNCVFLMSPTQLSPPFCGKTPIVRIDSCWPPPQVSEQSLHSAQSPHSQLIFASIEALKHGCMLHGFVL